MREIDQQILQYLQTIPEWKVVSYKFLWEKFWVHPRKIASVMRYNKDPITYPCYKVLWFDGKISGYNTKKGVSEKIEKLISDGIKISQNKVDKKYFL